ncbi:ras-related protein Rab-9A-like [Ischnura elegans]|uniref:ras-related protein Rab-9A-like n=1 Tax=Ischnura elegans TaxID=197161 RepID=UPI001ED8808D|nr:ras-related protein Rab-9A-like [Ischnura elegans]XP_046399762.1 ras-related protein Rab-9A-like [Ischnura elegans]
MGSTGTGQVITRGPTGIGGGNTLLKVVILGDGGVGKSCLMNRFVHNRFDEGSFHTIGVEFLNRDVTIGGETYTLQIWDTAGQERFKSLRTPFYRGSDICLLTFALDDRASFEHLPLWRSEFLHYADVQDDPPNRAFPFLVVGNKADLVANVIGQAKNDTDGSDTVTESESRGVNDMVGSDGGGKFRPRREVSREEAEEWCKAKGSLPYVEASARDATNVEAAFALAVERWARLEAGLGRPHLQADAVHLHHQGDRRCGGDGVRASCCLTVGSGSD